MSLSESLQKIPLSPRAIYQKIWLNFLFWFNKTRVMGGRSKSGERGTQSRLLRLLGNALTITGLVGGVIAIGFSIWFTGGLALPLWAALLMFTGISINFLALPVGSSANTVKIQTYYDAEWELQLLNNEKATIDQEPPHGMHGPVRQQVMLGIRYGHDVNGLLGTAASWVSSIFEILGRFTSVFMPIIGNIMYLAARASALFSATTSPLTNQHRLWVHKKNITDQINMYYDLCSDQNLVQHQRIQSIVKTVFTEKLKVNGDDNYYGTWTQFRCYRAVERILKDDNNIDNQTIIASAHQYIADFTKPKLTLAQRFVNFFKKKSDEPVPYRLDREKLRGILNKDSSAPTKHNEVCVLDSMPYFEERLYHQLQKTCTPQLSSASDVLMQWGASFFEKKPHEYHELFLDYLKSAFSGKTLEPEKLTALLESKDFSIYFKGTSGAYSVDTETMLKKWPIETSHGPQFIASHQLKQLANLVLKNYDLPEPDINNAAPEPEKTPTEIAEEIWLSIIQEDKDLPKEGRYDDHDPVFHGVKCYCMKYMVEKLKAAETIDASIKADLRIKIAEVVDKIKEESTFKKFIAKIPTKIPVLKKMLAGVSYKSMDVSKLPSKTENTDNLGLAPKPEPLKTPSLILGKQVYSYLLSPG
jgi:hypothetical protein